MSLRPALFIDRDGTLITNRPHSNDPAGICWYPGVFATLRRVQDQGYALVVVSNQSAVARGYCSCQDVEHFHAVLDKRLRSEGIVFSGFHYSPYHPDGKIAPYNVSHPSRKPQPGMLLEAATLYGLDLKRSWMIGDSAGDLGAGRNAGCRTLLVLTGYGLKTLNAVVSGEIPPPDAILHHLGCLAACHAVMNPGN